MHQVGETSAGAAGPPSAGSAPAPGWHPPWLDPAMPAREACVLGPLLEHWARRTPDAVFAIFADGVRWTWRETLREVRSAAQGLRALGVGPGDHVLACLPNGRPLFLTWFAANLLGAVYVPVNTSFRGQLLAHVIRNARARVMVCHARLAERLQGLDLGVLQDVVRVGDDPTPEVPGLRWHDALTLQGDPDALGELPACEPWDTCGIIYTSGTTGASKGVLTSYLQVRTTGLSSYGYIGPQDRMLINLPMFHVGGTSSIYAVLVRGASFVLVDGFDSRRFWDQVKELGCTTTCGLIGVMSEFLAKAPVAPGERDHPLRRVTLAPLTPQTVALAQRYGFEYLTGFNMTEVSVPLIAPLNSTAYGSCGQPRTGVQCRLVDRHDMEVPRGQVGELVLRTDLPWAMTTGYLDMPEATAAAWRNGWFHTGDMFRQDEAGNFYFVDRAKDAIRRRGENISSMEVEREVMAHPQVLEAAAVPVPADAGEDEVMVVVAPRAGERVDPEALLRFLIPRMAHFMVPRYVRVLPSLPKTPTNKVMKADLRRDGVTPDTWDREAAGVVVKRERLT